MPAKTARCLTAGRKGTKIGLVGAAANISPLSLLAGLGKGAAPKSARLRSQMAFIFIGGRDMKYIDRKRPTR
jgi:hypothetical protein